MYLPRHEFFAVVYMNLADFYVVYNLSQKWGNQEYVVSIVGNCCIIIYRLAKYHQRGYAPNYLASYAKTQSISAFLHNHSFALILKVRLDPERYLQSKLSMRMIVSIVSIKFELSVALLLRRIFPSIVLFGKMVAESATSRRKFIEITFGSRCPTTPKWRFLHCPHYL